MPKRRVGRYPKELRRTVVERFRTCKNISALSRELGCIEGYFTSGEINLIPLSVRIRWKQIHATPRSVRSSIG